MSWAKTLISGGIVDECGLALSAEASVILCSRAVRLRFLTLTILILVPAFTAGTLAKGRVVQRECRLAGRAVCRRIETSTAIGCAGAAVIVSIVVEAIATPLDVHARVARLELDVRAARAIAIRHCVRRHALRAVARSARSAFGAVGTASEHVVLPIVVVASWGVVDRHTGVVGCPVILGICVALTKTSDHGVRRCAS